MGIFPGISPEKSGILLGKMDGFTHGFFYQQKSVKNPVIWWENVMGISRDSSPTIWCISNNLKSQWDSNQKRESLGNHGDNMVDYDGAQSTWWWTTKSCFWLSLSMFTPMNWTKAAYPTCLLARGDFINQHRILPANKSRCKHYSSTVWKTICQQWLGTKNPWLSRWTIYAC